MKKALDLAKNAAKDLLTNHPECATMIESGQLSCRDLAMSFQMELFDRVHGHKLPKDPGREC